MAEALRDRRFVMYLVISNIVLVALAFAGPIWFATGLAALALGEVAHTLRTADERPAMARVPRR